MSYDPSQVAFVDTETTGLDPSRHRIWEIAVIVDGVEHSWFQHLSESGGIGGGPNWQFVDPWVLENTGIRDRYVHDDALDIISSTKRFVDLVRGRHLVGACPWFDSERLHRQWQWIQFSEPLHPWHYHLIDVETLIVGHGAGFAIGYEEASGMTHGAPDQALPWDSRELSRLVGVDPDDFQPAHTALTDARWAKACYEAVMGGPT